MTGFAASLFLSLNCININLLISKHVLKICCGLNGSQMLYPSTEHPKDNRQLEAEELHPFQCCASCLKAQGRRKSNLVILLKALQAALEVRDSTGCLLGTTHQVMVRKLFTNHRYNPTAWKH